MTRYRFDGATWQQVEVIAFTGPVASAGAPVHVEQGGIVPLTGTATQPLGLAITTYEWQLEPDVGLVFDAGSGGTFISSAFNPQVVASDAAVLGSHPLTFRARDSAGVWSTTSTTQVIVGTGGPATFPQDFVAAWTAGGSIPDPDNVGLFLDTVVTDVDGVTVLSWLDESGNGNDLTAAGGPQVITTPVGSPAVKFDGVNDGCTRTATTFNLPTGAHDRTVVAAFRYLSPGYGGFTYGTATQNQALGVIVDPAGDLMVQSRGGTGFDYSSGVAGTDAGWLVQSVVIANNTFSHYKNGALIDTQAHTYATTAAKIALGVDIDQSPFMNMEVGAVYLYDRALTDAERGQVEQLLSADYIVPPGPDTSPPTIAPGQNFTVAEASSIGFTIGTVSAGDDTGIATMTILAGNIGGAFSITNAGVLKVAATLNANVLDTYTLSIGATDLVGNTATPTNIVVHVSDTVITPNPVARQDIIDGAGLSNPGILTNSGSITTTAAGQLIENKNISGAITVSHNNVTIRNCKIVGRTSQSLVSPQRGIDGTIVEHCELNALLDPNNPCDKAANGCVGFLGVNTIVRYCECYGNSDGLKAESGGLYEYNYVHPSKPTQCTAQTGGLHCDGIQGSADSNWTARYNVIDCPISLGGNFPLFAQGYNGTSNSDIYNVTFGPGNWIRGGNTCVEFDGGKNTSNNGAFLHNMQFIDNNIFRTNDFGPNGTKDPTGDNVVRYQYFHTDNDAETYVHGNRWYGSTDPTKEGVLITASNGTPQAPGFSQDP